MYINIYIYIDNIDIRYNTTRNLHTGTKDYGDQFCKFSGSGLGGLGFGSLRFRSFGFRV